MPWIIDKIKDILPNRTYGKSAKDLRVARLIDLNKVIENVNEGFEYFSNYEIPFKEGSVGAKVSFRKESGTNPTIYKDVIIPGELEITRDNGGGIYNIAQENGYNSNQSPINTYWNTQYLDANNISWSPLWDIENRTYDIWRKAIQTPEGDYAPPQYVGMPVIMQYNNGGDSRYWLILFTEWGVGAYNEYNFAYDRYEIFPSLTFTRPDDTNIVDIISPKVHIGRESSGGQIYNVLDEPHAETGVSPRKTKWNSIYTDSRDGYYGFDDLSNLESRIYTDFALALDGSVGANVLNTDLIMHDMTTDLYYKVTFSEWTQSGNGGGFEYTRTVIPQSHGITFADGTILNTAPKVSACCPVIEGNGNTVIDNTSDNLVVIPGGTAPIDFIQEIANFSGMLMVNDHFDGGVEMWICGGGDCTLVSSTSASAGGGLMAQNGNGYNWANAQGLQGPFTFTVVKTRNGA